MRNISRSLFEGHFTEKIDFTSSNISRTALMIAVHFNACALLQSYLHSTAYCKIEGLKVTN